MPVFVLSDILDDNFKPKAFGATFPRCISGILATGIRASYGTYFRQTNYLVNFLNKRSDAWLRRLPSPSCCRHLSRMAPPGCVFGAELCSWHRCFLPTCSHPSCWRSRWRQLFRTIGLTHDTLWGLLITHLAISLPLAVWLLWGFFKSMPFDLEEAAMVDGCSQFEAFIKVVLPLSRSRAHHCRHLLLPPFLGRLCVSL